MRRRTAAVASAVAFLVGPGIMAGLVPWLLTGWEVRDPRLVAPPAPLETQ